MADMYLRAVRNSRWHSCWCEDNVLWNWHTLIKEARDKTIRDCIDQMAQCPSG